MVKKILEVKRVRLFPLWGTSRVLIEAEGTVPTSGWTDPELSAYVYVKPPADGIYEFDFCATPPVGIVSEVITDVTARPYIMEAPENFRGVRVYASLNKLEAYLPKRETTGVICVRGKLTDEGTECQALRSDDGQLYTLIGDLKGFKIGDTVIVCGAVAEVSICMQGTTIIVMWIGKDIPKLKAPKR
jgi:hypothetical protein